MQTSRHRFAELLRRDPRYRLEAYAFVFDALRYAQDVMGLGQGPPARAGDEGAQDVRHITGQQLCQAIRRYALRQYGPLAGQVLAHWGVRSTSDFGEIVFNLIDIGEMSKTDSDRREDFDEVFGFDDAFRDAFEGATLEIGKEGHA